MVALLLAACTDVSALYDKAREEALSVADGRPASWEPDVAVAVATETLQSAVDTAMDVALEEEMKPVELRLPAGLEATVRPKLQAEAVRVRPNEECSACFGFDARLKGKVAWTLGIAQGSLPVEVNAAGVIGLDVADGKRLVMTPRKLSSIKVASSKGQIGFDLDGPLQDYLRAALVDQLPPIQLTKLDTKGMPVRDLRLRTDSAGVVLELLSDVPGARPLARVSPPKTGVEVTLSETALVGLARRAAFEAGTMDYDIAVDPRTLDVDGSRFTLGMRLWRLSGNGWWRDYEITGDLRLTDRRIKLEARDAVEKGQSAGAALSDPLAALFEGKILEAIVTAATLNLPNSRRTEAGGVGVDAQLWRVEGVGEALVVGAELTVVPPK